MIGRSVHLEELKKTEDTEQESKPYICSFVFDVSIPEEDDGFRTFQKRYVFKKNVIKSIGFAIVGIGFLVSEIVYSHQIMNFVLMSVCAAAIFMIWYNNRHIRKSLMEALKMLEDDRYEFTLYDDSFKIETIIPEDEREDAGEIPPQVFQLDDPMLDAVEKDDKFIIIVKRATIYVLPKRCMKDHETEAVREKLIKTAEAR